LTPAALRGEHLSEIRVKKKSKSTRKKGHDRAKFKRRRLFATGAMRHVLRRKQKNRLKRRK
jgi:hypothetical protein